MSDITPETAITLASDAVPTATSDATVGEVLTKVQSFSAEFKTIDYVYILDGQRLVGVISIHELFNEQPHTLVRDCMVTNVAHVHSSSDQEIIAHLALAQNIKAVPVLNADNEFVGVVTSDVILRILQDEHTEDILKYAGINFSASDELSEYTLWQHFSSRIPWLIIGLLGGIAAAWVVEAFAETISKEVALAAFIPAIVYIADAVGSQTQMVFVRTLTNQRKLNIKRALRREIVIATTVGITLASLIGLLSYAWLQSSSVSMILSLAVLATVYFSVIVAVLLPWGFYRAGYDPAVATGPMATVIRDVSSLCIYFMIALSFL